LGMLAETMFTLLLDAINVPAKTAATVRACLGYGARWTTQNRTARGVSWSEAVRLLWPQSLLGVVAFACFAHAGWIVVVWAMPFAAGLMLAIPFCVMTASPAFGVWLRAMRIAAIPEEFGRA
jgi:membrane glycosyltransferase